MSAKPRDLPELDWRKVDRTVLRTAAMISNAIDRMIADLPEYAAPHMARVRLVRELTRLQPATMQQIMDDHYTREAYEASIAEIDRDFATLTAMCQENDSREEEQLERALQEARRQAKDQVRRQMGLR